MAWTYFTAPLAAGEEFTAFMWYELCEALAERFAATGQTTQVDLTAAASIRDARLAPRGVPISTSGGAAVLTPWTTVLSGTQANWAANTTTPAALTTSAGNSFVTSTQWTAESLTEAQWGTLTTAVSAGWHDRRYWNIIRATIQRLQLVRYPVGTSTLSSRGDSSLDPSTNTWAELVAAYFAAPVTTSSNSSPFSAFSAERSTAGGVLSISGSKSSTALTFASITAFTSAEVWIFVNSDSAYLIPDDDAYATLASTSGTLALSGTVTDGKLTIGSALNIQGPQTLAIKLGGYDTPAPYEPANNTIKERSYTLSNNRLFLAPTWSKP